jgi:hypothetical protein
MTRIAITFIIAITGTCWGVTLPVDCDFADDTPDSPPALGGTNEPSTLNIPGSGSILVKSAALGLNDQPCLIDQAGSAAYGSINFEFDPVIEDLLVFEATLSINVLRNTYVMQTAASTGGVVSRLLLTDTGLIVDKDDTVLGEYSAGVPFRCRMTVNIQDENWDCMIDDELDGFENDPVTEDLPFSNDPSVLPDVNKALASLGHVADGVAQVAYDDIRIEAVEVTATAAGTWSSVKSIY